MMKIILCLLALTDVASQWITYPYYRYIPYENVTNIDALNILGYTEDTWNVPGTAEVEGYLYENLNRTQIKALRSLGFTSTHWDCYQNHYRQLNWSRLSEINGYTVVETLGFNETIWDSGEDSEPFTLNWANLTPEQQAAAKRLCYFEKIWDGFSLAPLGENQDDYDYGNATDDEQVPDLSATDEFYYYPEEETPELIESYTEEEVPVLVENLEDMDKSESESEPADFYEEEADADQNDETSGSDEATGESSLDDNNKMPWPSRRRSSYEEWYQGRFPSLVELPSSSNWLAENLEDREESEPEPEPEPANYFEEEADVDRNDEMMGSDEPTDESSLGEQPADWSAFYNNNIPWPKPPSTRLPTPSSANTLEEDETNEKDGDFLSRRRRFLRLARK